MTKTVYSRPDCEVSPFSLEFTILDDSLRSGAGIGDTNPEDDWGNF